MSTLIPRTRFEDLPPDLAEALRPRVARLGYLGEFFQCTAHQPAALLSFLSFTEALKQALPDNLTEVVALTVAGATENRYERHQHERRCLALGLDERWVRSVNALRPDEEGPMTEEERLVQRLALAAIGSHGWQAGSAFEAVVRAVGPAAAMAVLMLIGRYVTHALIVNVLGLEPPVPSPLEGDR